MSKRLGPIAVCCDAPSYSIVRACQRVGIQSPEDVRWLRMSTFRCQQPDRTFRALSSLWEFFLGSRRPVGGAWACGGPLPELERVVVTFDAGEEMVHLLGQCANCRIVFWDVA